MALFGQRRVYGYVPDSHRSGRATETLRTGRRSARLAPKRTVYGRSGFAPRLLSPKSRLPTDCV